MIEEDENASAGGEPAPDEIACALGLTRKEPDADGEDLVEASVFQVEVLEVCDEELGLFVFDVRRISTCCGFDHLGRAVDGGQMASPEALTNERRGDAVATPDLEDPVIRLDAHLLDD